MRDSTSTLLPTLALAAGLSLSGLADTAEARGFRPGQLPNGSVNACANCHLNAGGGGPRNAFGEMVQANFLDNGNVVWGPELAALDADGDGATNGAELQDPNGEWRAGDDQPGDAALVTAPWDADSAPDTATAVAAETWARVKAAVRNLVD